MKTKWYDTYFWQVAFYVIGILLVAFLLSGCKTNYIPMEKIVYQDVIKHDTLHTYDSVVQVGAVSVEVCCMVIWCTLYASNHIML